MLGKSADEGFVGMTGARGDSWVVWAEPWPCSRQARCCTQVDASISNWDLYLLKHLCEDELKRGAVPKSCFLPTSLLGCSISCHIVFIAFMFSHCHV